MKQLLAGALLLLCVTGCGDPVPPPRVVQFVNLSVEQRLIADSLATILTREHLAVPDTFMNEPQGLRVSFLHAPFTPWQEPGCRGSYGSVIPAQPIARLIWDAMGVPAGLRRITLAARSERQVYGSWFRSVSCGPGLTELHFYPRDFTDASSTD